MLKLRNNNNNNNKNNTTQNTKTQQYCRGIFTVVYFSLFHGFFSSSFKSRCRTFLETQEMYTSLPVKVKGSWVPLKLFLKCIKHALCWFCDINYFFLCNGEWSRPYLLHYVLTFTWSQNISVLLDNNKKDDGKCNFCIVHIIILYYLCYKSTSESL